MWYDRFLTQRNVIVALILLLFGVVGFVVWQAVTFNVTSINPSLSNISNVQPYLDITVNHPIASADDVKLNDEFVDFEVVNENTLRVDLGGLDKDAENSISISQIKAKNGATLRNLRYTFTARYVAAGKLPEETQKALNNSSNSNQATDKFFLNNTFPINRDGYVIRNETFNYTQPLLEVTFVEEIAPGPGQPRPQVSNERALQLQKDLFDFIKAQGGKPESYIIDYSNEYLDSLNTGG